MYIKNVGHGPDLVLLHGWGLHSTVWKGVLNALSPRYRVTCADLPGHGRSGMETDLTSLEAVCAQLRTHLPTRCILAGWSLGGVIAIAYALRYPTAVNHLLLIASTPRFVKDAGWPHAMRSEILEGFGHSLELDYVTTLNRFLSLQVQSSEDAFPTLRQLRRTLFRYPPEITALRAGLTLLRNTDFRSRMGKLACPVGIILGERDMLVPKECGKDILGLVKRGRCAILSGAGHAPFLSHPKAFVNTTMEWLDD
jgi:pimeloyl-[acyl-carrier protein] methyl ester esterase